MPFRDDKTTAWPAGVMATALAVHHADNCIHNMHEIISG
jgi:hypothetical protein